MNEYELYHHGVLGMKWGVRRYQNRDGSYTRIGLEHYRKAEKRYDRVNSEYKATKKSHKEGSASKEDVRKARVQRKIEKHRMNQAYDQVRRDYKADRGKEAYQMGKTIRSKNITQSFVQGGLILGGHIAGIAVGEKFANTTLNTRFGQVNLGNLSEVSIRLGTIAVAAATRAKVDYDAGNMRAYYNHSRSYRDPDMKKGKKK